MKNILKRTISFLLAANMALSGAVPALAFELEKIGEEISFSETEMLPEPEETIPEENVQEEMQAEEVPAPDFSGKKVSILSHSASTYAGVSNDTNANSTIGKNDVYYTEGRHGVYRKDTWWQQTADALGMEVLVNNSWSGSCVFQPRKGEASVTYGSRAVNLHNDHTGEEPEVIWVYIGCNDFAYYKDTFGKAEDVDYSAIITDNGDGTFSYVVPTTTCEAYVITLHKIQNRYPDAKIYCMTSTARRETDYTGDSYPDAGQPTEYCAELWKIAEDFGFPVVDLEKAIPKEIELFDKYMGDKRAHPNALGMDQITNEVLSVMLGEEAEIRHVTSESGIVKEQAVLLGGSYSSEVELPEGYTLSVVMDGKDVAEEVYSGGKIFIEEVTGDIEISAKRGTKNFRWELENDVFDSVSGNGFSENKLTLLEGSISGGIFSGVKYSLADEIRLEHDKPWAIEWAVTGNWDATLFANTEKSGAKDSKFIFRSSTDYELLAIGEYDGTQYNNYGIATKELGLDMTKRHVYRLENRIAQDGSNMVRLYIDGKEIAPMNRHFIGSKKDTGNTSDWVSGKDFSFGYMGTVVRPINYCSLEYIEVFENGKPAETKQLVDGFEAVSSIEPGDSRLVDAHNTVSPLVFENLKLFENNAITALNLFVTGTVVDNDGTNKNDPEIEDNAEYTFDISVIDSSSVKAGGKYSVKKTYTLTVKGSEIRKNDWNTFDISDLGIVVEEGETLGFGSGTSSLEIFYINKNISSKLCYFGHNNTTGDTTLRLRTTSNLPIGVEGYSTKEPEIEDPKALKGKTLSILGASISTYAGTSNGAAADTTNSTIRNNAKYYPNNTVKDVALGDTWWMQFADDLGLRLLVNNSWSGGAILLERAGTVGAYVDRCVQLHDNTGENAGEDPDIIIIQKGFNDFSYGKSTLGTAEDINYEELILEDGYAEPKTTMEATVIMLDKMTKRYPDAEIYMFSHFKRVNQSAADTELMEKLNSSIETVCERYGIKVIDLYSVLGSVEFVGDGSLHPNRLGMDIMTEAAKRTVLANTAYEAETHLVSFELEGVSADYGDDKIVTSGDSFGVNLAAEIAGILEVSVTMGGKDITEAAYNDGKVSIEAVTGDVVIKAESVHEPKDYCWESDGTDLVCIGGENGLTKISGTTTGGVFSKTAYSLEEPVVLLHDKPWTVEWKCEGTFMNENGSTGARIFTSDNINANYNARYIFKSATKWLIAMGEKDSSGSHNYGIALEDHGIDGSALHTYRLENRIASDGSNMVYLFVDGKEIGALNNYYVGTTDKGTTSDWLSGKDFVFPYMGTDTHGFSNAKIDYIAVWENGEKTEPLSLRYDDRYDVSGKTVEIVDAGKPTSYKVGYGVAEGTFDDAVITISGEKLIATGIGTAKVRIDGILYEITVEASPISLFMITGHSMGAGQAGSKTESVVGPDGQVYSSHGKTNLSASTEGTGISFAAQTKANGINAFTEEGEGTIGEGSAFAWKWNMLTGEKVWVLNTAVGGSNLKEWIPGATNYKNAVNQYKRAQEILSNEIKAGHYVLSDMGIFYHNGANFSYKGVTFTQADLKNWYDSMWGGFKSELAKDMDGNGKAESVSFLGLVPIWTKSGGQSYTQDEPAGLFMAASAEYDDIFTVSVIGKEWLTDADVSALFPEIDYKIQSGAVLKRPVKSSEVFSSDNVHYKQVGYNAVGIDIAENLYEYLRGENELSEVKLVYPETLGEIEDNTELVYGEELIIVPIVEPITYSGLEFASEGIVEISYPLAIKATGNGTGKLIVSAGGKVIKELNFVCSSKPEPLSLRYDDRYDVSGKTVEIVDAGKPTSYKVGYGVAEGTLDDAVITLDGEKLIATGIGTAKVRIDGVLYEITVEAAPISLLLLIGQSNMRGSEGNANQSIICPEGVVYATYGDDRGADNTAMSKTNARFFAPSALAGEYSSINVEGTTECLSGYPVYSLNEAGAGKIGPDSGFGYEWAKQTGEKVWIANAAHGGTSINAWQDGGKEFEECEALFKACQETLQKEIAAGHFTLSHMAYFWCQGCSDAANTAEQYAKKYLSMHESLKTVLAFDHDSDSATKDYTFEFGGIIPVRAGNESSACYRQGVYTDTTTAKYHESFKDLRFTGPRVAQYWMINNPELPDIWGVCNIGEDWVWMPDGTNGVSDYFNAHYENGRVDYETQVAQKENWYTPTTPAAVHDSIHYNQIGYNEIGRESVRNALIMLGEIKAPETETTVELLSWNGYTEVSEVPASTTGNSGTLVVPKVYPLWEAKNVEFNLSEGLQYVYYDLIADSAEREGTLSTEGKTVSVIKTEPGAHYKEHLSTLPEKVCSGLNLWNVLPHDEYYFASGTNWGKHSSGNVYSVTIPVEAGDKIFATSFGKAVENGHATANGIRTTFFSAYGVAKTMTPAECYAEFSKNGGYLVAPEGATAINVAMWSDSSENELYILSAKHEYEGVSCSVCGLEHPNAANFEGKIISIMGDSISTFAGYIPVADGFNLEHRARYPQSNLLTDVNLTWWMQTLTELDAKLGINDSWAGSRVLNTRGTNSGDVGPDAAIASLTRIQNLGANGTPDVILFYGGTNDITGRSDVGTFSPKTAPTEVDLTSTKWETVADAYVAAIMRMQYYYPDAEIIAMFPTFTSKNTDEVIENYNSVFAEICEHYGVKYTDLRDCGITTADLPDGTHPNAKGMDYITDAVLEVMTGIEIEAGESVVYSVTHELENVKASLGYYKGISAGKAFAETLEGENLSVTVTMNGVDITETAYKDGKISIASATGDIVVTATGKEQHLYADHLQALPEKFCAGTDLWKVLEPENIYYTASGWGLDATGLVHSVTVPISAGDRIWATSFQKSGTNGGNGNGIRITWFDEKNVIKSKSPNEVYTEFTANGYLTAPEGAIAVNIPMWDNSDENEIYLLDREHSFGEWTEVKAPACDAEGQDKSVCGTCGETIFRDTRISGGGNKILVSNPLPENYYEGKTFLAIGDSLTNGTGVEKDERYHSVFAQKLGGTNINGGTSGATLCPGGHLPNKFEALMTADFLKKKNVDVVTIFLGINDWDNGVLNGTYQGVLKYDENATYYDLGEFGTDDTATIYGAAKMWCERILEIKATEGCEDIQFMFATPVITSYNKSVTNKRDWNQDKLNVFGHTLREYCTAIMEVCEYYEIPVLDLNMYSGMYYNSETDNNVDYFGGDGIHPGKNGHAMMADAFVEFLLEGYSYEERNVANCGHSYVDEVVAPSCEEEGYTVHKCPECHNRYIDSYVPAAGHSYENGICTVCGEWKYSIGDINLDGEVNVKDAYYARLVAAKLIKPTDEQLLVGDVDLDGRITALDANIIRKFVAHLIEKLPVTG